MSDVLPDAALKLLGDDATPEMAAKLGDEGVGIYLSGGSPASDAKYAWCSALAAAAIRAMEATLARKHAREGADDLSKLIERELETAADYNQLRNWRNR